MPLLLSDWNSWSQHTGTAAQGRSCREWMLWGHRGPRALFAVKLSINFFFFFFGTGWQAQKKCTLVTRYFILCLADDLPELSNICQQMRVKHLQEEIKSRNCQELNHWKNNRRFIWLFLLVLLNLCACFENKHIIWKPLTNLVQSALEICSLSHPLPFPFLFHMFHFFKVQSILMFWYKGLQVTNPLKQFPI